MFFNDSQGLVRVLVLGVCLYLALVLMLRMAGKRTLSKMNAFDLVITVALGSTLSSVITSKDIALAEGLLALGLLIALQVAVAFLASRSSTVSRVVKSEPRLLLRNGEVLDQALADERLTRGELEAAAREQGLSSLAQAQAIVLESSGELSVIPAGLRGSELSRPPRES